VKTKRKIKIAYFFCILLIIPAAFFVFNYSCFANENPIISAVQTKGNNANDDFIEIYNPSCNDINISDWKIIKRTASGTESSIKVISHGTVIKAKSYFLWSNSGFSETVRADQSTVSILSDNYSIALFNDDKITDSITWGINSNPFFGSYFYSENLLKSQVLKKDADGDFSTEINYLPKNSSIVNEAELSLCKKEDPVSVEYSNKLQISELLPNPEDGDEEYIEFYNNSDEKINLKGWSLHDASKSGEYVFLSADYMEPEEYFVIYKSDFKFALNNSGDENLVLFDPNKKDIFEVSYSGSKKGISYSFDGNEWHWSKFLTPGEENKFEKIHKGKPDIDENIYVNVYANFKIGRLSKKAKVTWDFGDGHKSYLKKTKHKYKKAGKYEGSVKYSEGSEDRIEKFTIEVVKMKHPEVKIISVNANPIGSDTENETITVENKSKKKINLNGWSIATGWKKLINHPISIDFEIKAGKSREITREISKFTLNNTKNEIELRYPDGKVAYDLKYKKKNDSIKEGEIYTKSKGGWIWVGSNKQVESSNQEAINSEQEDININGSDDMENISEADIISKPMFERENKLVSNNKKIFKIELSNNYPRVLGEETVREIDGTYFFTAELPRQSHYMIIFIKDLFTVINLKLNFIINFFLN